MQTVNRYRQPGQQGYEQKEECKLDGWKNHVRREKISAQRVGKVRPEGRLRMLGSLVLDHVMRFWQRRILAPNALLHQAMDFEGSAWCERRVVCPERWE